MSNSDDGELLFGAKRITAANMMQPDVSRLFGARTEAEWIALFADQKLADYVPEPIQKLFELARGTMTYAWLYYPLLALGYIECTKTLEAAARHAAAAAGTPKALDGKEKSYADVIKQLHTKRLLDDAAMKRWTLGRELRNAFAHPTDSAILPPSYASEKLRMTADRINQLFAAVRSLA